MVIALGNDEFFRISFINLLLPRWIWCNLGNEVPEVATTVDDWWRLCWSNINQVVNSMAQTGLALLELVWFSQLCSSVVLTLTEGYNRRICLTFQISIFKQFKTSLCFRQFRPRPSQEKGVSQDCRFHPSSGLFNGDDYGDSPSLTSEKSPWCLSIIIIANVPSWTAGPVPPWWSWIRNNSFFYGVLLIYNHAVVLAWV